MTSSLGFCWFTLLRHDIGLEDGIVFPAEFWTCLEPCRPADDEPSLYMVLSIPVVVTSPQLGAVGPCQRWEVLSGPVEEDEAEVVRSLCGQAHVSRFRRSGR
jgi:hypothetical protein